MAADHFPIVPLFGKTISETLVTLLYPAEVADVGAPTLKAVGHALKTYVESLTTPNTMQLAKASLAGLVTSGAAGNQAGTTVITTAESEADAAALKAWAHELVNKTLDPFSSSVHDTRRVSFADQPALNTPTVEGTATIGSPGLRPNPTGTATIGSPGLRPNPAQSPQDYGIPGLVNLDTGEVVEGTVS